MNMMQFPCCRFDLKALPVDFVECLMRFLPTDAESKLLRQYERERRPLDQLAEEDRFMLFFSKIERLTQRMSIITFVGNFSDNVSMLTPVSNYDGQQMESWESFLMDFFVCFKDVFFCCCFFDILVVCGTAFEFSIYILGVGTGVYLSTCHYSLILELLGLW